MVQLMTDTDHAGSLRACDPDRVVLKKLVLSGYPVRMHKGKAAVPGYMAKSARCSVTMLMMMMLSLPPCCRQPEGMRP